jgi:hypothetical protein
MAHHGSDLKALKSCRLQTRTLSAEQCNACCSTRPNRISVAKLIQRTNQGEGVCGHSGGIYQGCSAPVCVSASCVESCMVKG